MLPPEHIVDQMPDPNRKRRTRLDEMTQDVEDTKPPDKMFDMPKGIKLKTLTMMIMGLIVTSLHKNNCFLVSIKYFIFHFSVGYFTRKIMVY
jgi:hypothetical protein